MRAAKRLQSTFLLAFLVLCGYCLFPGRSELRLAPGSLADKEFSFPDLAINTAVVPLQSVMTRLPNAASWKSFILENGSRVAVYIDPRSGTPASIICSTPLIPGAGTGNRVKPILS